MSKSAIVMFLLGLGEKMEVLGLRKCDDYVYSDAHINVTSF